MLTIALSKGKMLDLTLDLFRRAGYDMGSLSTESRRLIFPCPEIGMTFLIVRPTDVPTYVEYGAADVGIVGKDVLMEQESDVYEPLDLGSERVESPSPRSRDRPHATGCPRKFGSRRNIRRSPSGISISAGCRSKSSSYTARLNWLLLVGLADRIVDLVETGNTLKAHDLVEVECITQSTARLIVNRASLKLKHEAVTELIKKLRALAVLQSLEQAPRANRYAGARRMVTTDAHMKIVATTERAFLPALKKVASRARVQGAAVEKTVKSILQAVERGGDKAVLRYTKQFDRVSMKDTELRVTPEEIKEAYFHIRKDEGDALRFAAQRITSFHERQRMKTWMYQDDEATLGQVVTPVDAVGVYVPGGKAVYPSSVLDVRDSSQGRGRPPYGDVYAATKRLRSIPICWSQPILPALRRFIASGACKPSARWPMGPRPSGVSIRSWDRAIFMLRRPSGSSTARSGSTWWQARANCWSSQMMTPNRLMWRQIFSAKRSMTKMRRSISSPPRPSWPRMWCELIGSQLKGLQREKIAAKSIARHSVAFVVATMDEAIEVANEIAAGTFDALGR